MGDVFDAMNRAERERGSHSESDSQAGAGKEETPSLQLDPVANRDLSDRGDGTQERDARQIDSVARTPSSAVVPPGELASHESLNGYSDKVVVHHDRGSIVTEQYRAIRTQILARARNRRLQVHVITSSVPEEGKSVTAANLGVVFSELRNKKILVIEGDLRRPSFQKLFGRSCTPGLVQVLRGDLDDPQQAVHSTVYDNLKFVPAGGRDPTHCTELLSSPGMIQVLDRFREQYDHIFIDTPPVISVTDAAILAAMGDQALLVVRLHKTPVEMVERAKRLLHANNCNVSGVILTHMKMIFLPGYMSRYSYGSAYA